MGQNPSWEGYSSYPNQEIPRFYGIHNVTAAFKIATGPHPTPGN